MGGSQSVEDGAKKKSDDDGYAEDGYAEPQIRARSRQQPKRPEVLTDADVAAFDPTADKYAAGRVRSSARAGERLKVRRPPWG